MKKVTLKPVNVPLTGNLSVPGDKSISHRAIIFGSLARGKTKISNFLNGEDCLMTIKAFQSMGVKIDHKDDNVVIDSEGVTGFKEPLEPIYFGNSGTTARLMLGLLAGLPFHTTVYGDPSLTKRPMDRIRDPLIEMGAKIDGRNNGSLLPIAVRGQSLTGITFKPPVKSAQVKSGVLLAGLLAEGETTVIETTKTRDHTETMLSAFGGEITVNGNTVTVKGNQSLTGTEIEIPGDISSAAFFIVGALLVPGSQITIKNVGLNPTRTGLLDVLNQMGANLKIVETRRIGGEPIGDITVQYRELNAIEIDGDVIPRMIDEFPILALLATQIEGKTIIRDAEELRHKETDRISSVVNILNTLGAKVKGTDDGMIIEGKSPLIGGEVNSDGDHRLGMMIAIASLICQEDVTLVDPDVINISYPNFFDDLKKLQMI
ncbi:3-phosphoshikimate 1-carboxyvinyltransferase [Amphibacillus xylanus]|uniref:3-phosphoshikimate 1-carboxyvinyltransferase n=1 Tax=Amphibacillus xylanus (strain ATCC 51415 / DSM 6626 / JCM 7361 / LMG 17667 / NBRC 15112 / Ep01) TaxID=698758 RepID=K0IY02_AMPXN|nr:3-phosphoshikimate 1-carboxyvinyltransferase [Amphibacillus xylanus]BAM47380.1 3-phosphoshikimate 1-carboxyvinyltransferase [Amphibacillus xylanus NBRC 15112]